MESSTHDLAFDDDGTDQTRPAGRGFVRGVIATLIVATISGWGAAGYLYLVVLPDAQATATVRTALDLVDRFYSSNGERAYQRLAEALKPWWSSIDEIQRKIAAASNDEERLPLIQKRDQMLVDFITEKGLREDVDAIIGAFDPFQRCLATSACDEDTLRGTIGVDVRRVYRTFRPYVQVRRDGGERDYARAMEELFLRFVS